MKDPGTIEKAIVMQQSKGDGLQDFRDGDQCKAKSLFSEGLTPFYFTMMTETVNPLGSKKGIHKLGLIYFVVSHRNCCPV